MQSIRLKKRMSGTFVYSETKLEAFLHPLKWYTDFVIRLKN